VTGDSTQGQLGRVYVVDDDPGVNESITWTLNSVGYIVETFLGAPEFLSKAKIANPSVVIIDLLLPGMTGLNLCREILARRLACSFVVISGHADVPSALEAMHLGAIDLLEKPFSRQRLLEIVDKALRVACANHRRIAEEDEVNRRLQDLSPRERQVFDAIAAGLMTKEIAKQLELSVRTVDVHRSRITQKLGLESPLQLANLLAVIERKASRSHL
jgi:FixJ family two-component response regulator